MKYSLPWIEVIISNVLTFFYFSFKPISWAEQVEAGEDGEFFVDLIMFPPVNILPYFAELLSSFWIKISEITDTVQNKLHI